MNGDELNEQKSEIKSRKGPYFLPGSHQHHDKSAEKLSTSVDGTAKGTNPAHRLKNVPSVLFFVEEDPLQLPCSDVLGLGLERTSSILCQGRLLCGIENLPRSRAIHASFLPLSSINFIFAQPQR